MLRHPLAQESAHMASRFGPGAPPTVRGVRLARHADDLLPLQLETCMQGPKSAEAVEQEQEAKLKAKYGALGTKKKLMPKVWTRFASCVAQHAVKTYLMFHSGSGY